MKRLSSSNMLYLKLVFFVLGALVPLSHSQGNWDGLLILSENYYLHINSTGNEDTGEILLTFLVNTRGFVGFGISNHPNMTDADIFIGGYFANNDTTYGKVR